MEHEMMEFGRLELATEQVDTNFPKSTELHSTPASLALCKI